MPVPHQGETADADLVLEAVWEFDLEVESVEGGVDDVSVER